MAIQIQLRRGTASEWTSANTVLAEGEMGLETDTSKYKIGDGSTAWTALSYSSLPSNALSASAIDAKGDLLVGTADDTVDRLSVGADGYYLKANSSTPTGLEWGALVDVSTTIDAKGDLLVGTADNTVDRLAKGTDGLSLIANSATTTGLSWKHPSYLQGYSGSTLSGEVRATSCGLYLDSNIYDITLNANRYVRIHGEFEVEITSSLVVTISSYCGLSVDGNIYAAGTKFFDIEHPIDSTKRLRYCATESPQPDLIYKGVGVTDESGYCEIDINSSFNLTSGTYESISGSPWAIVNMKNSNCSWDLTPSGISVSGPPDTEFYWILIAERQDLKNKNPELYNENGSFMPEYIKS